MTSNTTTSSKSEPTQGELLLFAMLSEQGGSGGMKWDSVTTQLSGTTSTKNLTKQYSRLKPVFEARLASINGPNASVATPIVAASATTASTPTAAAAAPKKKKVSAKKRKLAEVHTEEDNAEAEDTKVEDTESGQ